jgi:hypothetical protein
VAAGRVMTRTMTSIGASTECHRAASRERMTSSLEIQPTR